MRAVVSLALAGVLAAGASVSPSFAADRGMQGGMSNRNNLNFVSEHRTMRQQDLINEMRRLRGEMRAVKARNGGLLPEAEKARFQGQLDALKAEYRQAG